ncbi:MAG: flagellar biosynthetic protein FliQ [Lentisphaerota bacterium]
MTPEMALDLAYLVIFTSAKISAPILLTAVVVGVLINIIQTITSIKDMSLTFVPKVIVASLVVGLTLPWSIKIMNGFFAQIFQMFGQFGTG